MLRPSMHGAVDGDESGLRRKTQGGLPVDSLFQVHRLNEDGMKKAAVIAASFDRCLNELTPICQAGRELAIVKTKLEEACFFAKKAMASNPVNQEPTPVSHAP